MMNKENPLKYAEIFHGTEEDLDELFALAETFWHESNFHTGGLTLQPDFWKESVRRAIDDPECAALCVRADDKIVGYVLIYYQTEYTAERIGEMFQFYVSPEYRGTNIARELVAAAVKQWDEWGCARVYCEASPGISLRDHLGLFKNLWGKFGFEQIGITLMKEMK